MNKKVEIFTNEWTDKMQNEINEFLKDKTLVDIKFSSSKSGPDYNEEICFSALVIYEVLK